MPATKRYMTSRQVQKLSSPGPAPLGQARHAALEGVAVQVRQAGQADGVARRPPAPAATPGRDGRDQAVLDRTRTSVGPAVRQQRVGEARCSVTVRGSWSALRLRKPHA